GLRLLLATVLQAVSVDHLRSCHRESRRDCS
ncbi:SELENOF isoform 8, partial [Pan troglodytes]